MNLCVLNLKSDTLVGMKHGIKVKRETKDKLVKNHRKLYEMFMEEIILSLIVDFKNTNL